MVRRALDKKMWRDLWLLKVQTFTTAILIICGVALLVSEWSAYRSLQRARDQYYREFKFADIFAEFKRASIEPISLISKIPGVQIVSPRISIEGLVNVPNHPEPAVGRFLSLPPGSNSLLNQVYIRRGRLPIDSSEIEIVVYEGFAKANNLGPGDRFEVLIQGHIEQVRIVGIGISPEYVYALSPSAPLPDDFHFGVFWMTEKTLQRLLGMEGGYNSLVAKLYPAASVNVVIAEIDRVLSPYGAIGAYARDRQISNMFVEDEISQQRVSSVYIPTIFLSIAAFLINIITSRLVSLHRPQIASLKALGYTRFEVSFHYLKLILFMTLVGTLPGIGVGALLGRWLSSTYASYFRFPELDFSISAEAAIVGVFAGILPGLIGAMASIRSIFRLAPAEAMRPLAPASFQATLFEKLKLHKCFRSSGLMVFRHLLQRPLKLFQVVLSLSAALAIVISSGAWSDMIDFLLKTQFQRIQREDLSISLIRPRPVDAIEELKKIPGIIGVEAFREVPVRIKYLNHKRELQLVGRPESTSMRRLLNQEFEEIPISSTGVLLIRFFEKSWGMKRGDLIQLQPLEGRARIFTVPVVGFTDEMVGISANMQIHSLWKLMNEESGYNVIGLKADPRKLNEIYIKLKSFPEVGAVHLKNALYQGFNESFGQVIRTATLVLMIASLTIALGIIYNSVRVSLSERSWELASLRVLGFEKSEVARVLLFEVGIQVALSLLPGCLLGLWLTRLSMKLIHTETFAFPVVIQSATYARGLLAILLAFVGSCVIVYQMLGRLNPAEALKARE